MTKIYQYNHSFYPIEDGSSNYIKNIVESIPEYEFVVLTTGLVRLPTYEKIRENVVVQRFPPKDFGRTTQSSEFKRLLQYPVRLLFEWIRLFKIYREMKNANYDILHVHGMGIPASLFLDNKLKTDFFTRFSFEFMKFDKIKKPKILTIHGLTLTPIASFDYMTKNLINIFDNIIYVDKNIYKYVTEKVEGADREKKIWYVPNAVDITKFSYTPRKKHKKLTVGFIGRLEMSRGVDLLIELVKHTPQYIKLVIIGAGSDVIITRFRNRIDMSKIDFYTNIPNSKIPYFIHQFDVLFNPVLAEGISRVTLESMSCGCPVIMIDKGNRYPVIHMNTGFLVKPNVEDVLKILEYIQSDIGVLDEMGIKARKFVKSEFSTVTFANIYKKIYKEIRE